MPCAIPTIIASCGFLIPNCVLLVPDAGRLGQRLQLPAVGGSATQKVAPLFFFPPQCLTKGREETTPSSPKEASQIQASGEPRQGLRRWRQAASGGPQETPGSQAGSFCEAELSHRECGQHRDLCPRGPDPALRPGSK